MSCIFFEEVAKQLPNEVQRRKYTETISILSGYFGYLARYIPHIERNGQFRRLYKVLVHHTNHQYPPHPLNTHTHTNQLLP